MREGRLKRVAFQAFAHSGLLRAVEAWARGVPILAYHGVTARPDGPIGNRRRLHVPVPLFEEHLRMLRSRWTPLSLSTLWTAHDSGRPLPPRAVVLTIDDGYRNVLTQALPLLRGYGIPATVFVVTGPEERRLWMDRLEVAIAGTPHAHLEWDGRTLSVGTPDARKATLDWLVPQLDRLGAARTPALQQIVARLEAAPAAPDEDRDRMSWDEVRALASAGVEIGSHADIHEPLTERPLEAAREGLAESRRALERELGPAQYALAYPFGAWNPSLAAAARDAGFVCALSGDPGLNHPATDAFALKRMLLGADDDVARLRASLSGLRALWSPRSTWRGR